MMSPRQPTSRELIAAIQPAKEMATKLTRRVGRFEIYELLEAIYRVYIDWKRRKTAKRSAHALADQLAIVRRKGMSPIRVLIEATHCDPTVNLHDWYVGVRNGRVEALWPVSARGAST